MRKPPGDLWLVSLSPSQGEWVRVFIRGVRDPREAVRRAEHLSGVWGKLHKAEAVHFADGSSPASNTPTEPLWESCPKCIEHLYIEQPGLLHAFASVGIEHGKSSFEMAETYFAEFHKKGHKE